MLQFKTPKSSFSKNLFLSDLEYKEYQTLTVTTKSHFLII